MNNLHITHPNEEQTREMLGLQDYEYLGYMNGWGQNKSAFARCRLQKHKIEDRQHNSRGSNVTQWCNQCRIFWKVDMSD